MTAAPRRSGSAARGALAPVVHRAAASARASALAPAAHPAAASARAPAVASALAPPVAAVRRGRARIACGLALVVFAAAGCGDLAGYTGAWRGGVVGDADLLAGLPPASIATLRIDAADRLGLAGALTLGAEMVTLRPLTHAANDTLGALELPDAPLRSYLLLAPLAAGDALAVVSLYPDARVDLRLLRGDALYAVFHLRR